VKLKEVQDCGLRSSGKSCGFGIPTFRYNLHYRI